MNPPRIWLAAGVLLLFSALAYWLVRWESAPTGAAPTAPVAARVPGIAWLHRPALVDSTDVQRPAAEPELPEPPTADVWTENAARLAAEAARKRETAFTDSLEAAAAAACPPRPVAFGRNKWLRPPLRVRRYLGLVGADSVMALLSWPHPDSVQGRFMLLPAGDEYTVAFAAKPGRLTVRPNLSGHDVAGTWQLTSRPGPTITGTWTQGKVRKPIQLREDYSGAVRCEILTLRLAGGRPESWKPGLPCYVPGLSQEYLHLLEDLAQRPELRPFQCPSEPVRRRQLRREYSLDDDVRRYVTVRLNGFGVLSYETFSEAVSFGLGRTTMDYEGAPLFDLVGGQAWPLDRLLRPGYWLPVRRRAAWHLRHDATFRSVTWEWQQADPQAARDTTYSFESWKQPDLAPRPWAWVLTGAGLELTYSYDTLNAVNAAGWDTVLIPYRELRPLVRPGTPLDRMLRARGM